MSAACKGLPDWDVVEKPGALTQLSSAQASKMYSLLKQGGMGEEDLNKLSAANPFAIGDSPTARNVRMILEASDPLFHSELLTQANPTPSLAYAALRHEVISGQEIDWDGINSDLKVEYQTRHAAELQQQQQAFRSEVEAKLLAEAEAATAAREAKQQRLRTGRLNAEEWQEQAELAASRERAAAVLKQQSRYGGIY